MRRTIKQCSALGLASLAGVLCAWNVAAAAPPAPQGVITAKVYMDIGGGTTVADLTGNAKFPGSPDQVLYPQYMELWATGDINTAPPGDVFNSYGAQLEGYFYPPSTGDYVFYVCSDDSSNLYLSTDDTPANKKLIAQETGWSGVRNYTSVGGGSTVEAKDSQTFTGTQWPTKDTANGGAKITLTKGKAYYIQALFKEGGGGDDLSVSIDGSLPIDGSLLASIDKTTGPLTITTQPASQTINEGSPVTLSLVVDGTPPYTYVWRKNGTPFATNAAPSYTISRVTYAADNGAKYSVVVTGAVGTATSTDATLTINKDTAPPTLASVSVPGPTVAIVVFSEPLDQASAETAANYKLSGGVSVTAAKLGATAGTTGDNKVFLTTSAQPSGTELTLTVNNVKDAAGNVIAPNSTITFKGALLALGWATYEVWWGDTAGIDTFATAILDGSQRPPDVDSAVNQFGHPWGIGDNYNARVYGYFIPPANGDYVFFVAGDDQCNVYLSTDDKPANKKLIAQETGWNNQYQWVTAGGSTLESKRSDQFGNTEWDTGNVITLKGGQKYYLEVLHHEGGGGDGVDVTYIKAGDPDPAQSAAGMFLKGNVIATYLDPNGATITISQDPVDATQQELRSATFTVAATGSSSYGSTVTYQWQKAAPGSSTFTDIAGATAASYSTPLLALADTGTQYKVICSVPTLSKASAVAKLTVVPDTFPPKLEAAGSIMKGTAIEVGVSFDENVDAATASAPANYSLSKGTITGIRYQRFDHAGGVDFFQLGSTAAFKGAAVVLTTTGLTGGDTVTLTAKNVKDIKGNAMSATGESKTFIVGKKMKWAGMGGNDYATDGEFGGQNITADPTLWPDDVVAYSDADFDLISAGTANWNNYDEATFVYEEVTGDFDKVVRCEYQDPTSQWARQGMCATPSTDEGVTRAQATGGTMMEKRYMLRANPPVQWNGSAGNNQNEADWRDAAGGNYSGAGAGNPAYPNAWLRMQRIGQTFNGFYSSDGKVWTSYGAHTFTDAEPMPDKLMVGIYYCPEFGNNGSGEGVGHATVGKYRQYGNYVAKPSEVAYGVGLNFGADEPNGGFGGILPSVGTAGVPGVIQGNWNNLTNATGSSTVIMADKKGLAQPTAVSVTWSCPNTWASTGRGEENNKLTDNDKLLMTGYLDTGAASTTTVEISGLPTELTGKGYDVYVYLLGGVANKGGGYAVADANDTVLTPWVDAQCPVNPTNHVQAVPTAGTWAVGDYVLFKNLTAPSIKVLASTENGHGFGSNPRAPINAIQIVQTGGGATTPPGKMTISLAGAVLTINWDGNGTLQSATTLGGTWTDIGSAKPYTGAASGQAMYFRVKGQ